MQERWLLGGAVAAGLAGLVGCGIGISGLGPGGELADAGALRDGSATQEGGTSLDAGGAPIDASHDAMRDAPTIPCTASLPAGWSPALFENARAACPAGSPDHHDGVSGGSAGANACTCSCAVGGPVTCETGTLEMATGTAAAACNGGSMSVAVDSEFCAPLPKTIPMPAYMAVPTIPPSGSCTASAVTDSAQLSKDAVRWCDVPAAGAENVCAGGAPQGFEACVAHAGSVACPAGSPFAARRLVSDDVTLSCSACSSCELTGRCGSATVAFFSDGNCNSAVIGLNADGRCNPTAVASTMVGSVLYNSSIVDAGGCVGGGTSATIAPSGSMTTLCCR
jgi:hypothetical protein